MSDLGTIQLDKYVCMLNLISREGKIIIKCMALFFFLSFMDQCDDTFMFFFGVQQFLLEICSYFITKIKNNITEFGFP